ncbi:MAG: Crp/Fnr family transcriptional regulator [Pyrinomonadaceae bacterium]
MSFVENNTGFFIADGDLPFPVYRKRYGKNDILLCQGQVESCAYFLIDGIVEIDVFRNGVKRIVDFYFPGSFFCALTSFLLQEPSEAETIALTDIEVEVVKYDDLQEAYEKSLLANQLGRRLIEEAYLVKFQREKDFLTKTAEVRYLELMKSRPELLKKLPVHKIAEYLGIQPESLSRIRKSIIS